MEWTAKQCFPTIFYASTFTDEAFHDLGRPFQRIIRKPEIVNIIRRMAIIYGRPNIYAPKRGVPRFPAIQSDFDG